MGNTLKRFSDIGGLIAGHREVPRPPVGNPLPGPALRTPLPGRGLPIGPAGRLDGGPSEAHLPDQTARPGPAARAPAAGSPRAGQPTFGASAESAAALEEMPRICTAVTTLWGAPEFGEYMERLILVEPERVGRAGFPPNIAEELVFLYRLHVDQGPIVCPGVGYAPLRVASDRWHLSR